MRRSYSAKIIEENGKVIGLSFGADFCAEHEWGIKGIKDSFGISESLKKIGSDRYKITTVPPTLHWREENGVCGILFSKWLSEFKHVQLGKDETCLYDQSCAAAWSEYSFGFCCKASDKTQVEKIRQVYDALIKEDAVIMLCGRDFFQIQDWVFSFSVIFQKMLQNLGKNSIYRIIIC